jgi:O-antigen/teichoic acid export membrane protein
MLYRVVVATISSEKQIITTLKLSFISSIAVSAIGIVQKLGVGPVVAFLNTYYPTANLYPEGGVVISATDQRITSTLGSFSGLAGYLCFTLILALTCYTTKKRGNISQLLLLATLLLDSAALFLTGTFAAFFGLAIGAVVIFLISRRVPKTIIFTLVVAVPLAIIFHSFISDRFTEWLGGGSTGQSLLPTYSERIRLWKDIFLPAIGQHIVFGSGPAPAVSQLWISEESQYIALLLRGGLFYLCSYLLLLGIAMASCWRLIKDKPESASRMVALALLAILIAMSFMNVSEVYFTYVGGTQTIWMLLAIVVARGQCEEPGQPAALGRPVPRTKDSVDPRRKAKVKALSFSNHADSMRVDGPPGKAAGDAAIRDDKVASGDSGLKMDRRDGRLHLAGVKRLLDWSFVKDSAVVGMGSTLARFLGLLFTILLAHFLTSDDFGFYRYLITLVGIVTFVGTASPASIARFIAVNSRNRQAQDRYFTNSIFGLAVLLVIALLISIPILWHLHALNFGTISCIIGLTAFYGYLAIVRGLGEAWKMSLTYILSNVALIVALLTVIVFLRLHTATVAVAIFGLTDLVPILLLECIRPMRLRFHLSLVSPAVLLELARFALPIVIATGAYTIWSGLDMLLVQNLIPHAAGSYAVAKTVAGAFLFVPAAIAMVLMPRVAVLTKERGKRYCAGASLVAFLVSLAGLVIVYAWGHQLIAFAFGQRYKDAYLPLLVQIVGMAFYSVYAVLEGFAIGRGRPMLAAQALLVALACSGATVFWLTPRLGTLGASLSFTIGAALGTSYMLFTCWFFFRGDERCVPIMAPTGEFQSGSKPVEST